MLVLAALSVAMVQAQLGNEGQNVTLDKRLQIPGEVLKPGSYTFSLEDRMGNRAIVRIESKEKGKHHLVLAVPSGKLPRAAGQDGLVYFNNSKQDKQVLRGWQCRGCGAGLEIVYPKLEAAKITGESGQSVLAVDPESDKLPKNLSADDMKVVTLWLLSPQRITADNRGEGLNAAKYEGSAEKASPRQTASQPVAAPIPQPAIQATPEPVAETAPQPAAPTMPETAPQATPQTNQQTAAVEAAAAPESHGQIASGSPHRRLPKTASNTYLFAVLGFMVLLSGIGLRLRRTRREASAGG
jgi:LPXTG-motif cell wall-anchored protein